ncbi:MAG: dienelactone hydrolase family protein [Bryobacteraceae bacterium]
MNDQLIVIGSGAEFAHPSRGPRTLPLPVREEIVLVSTPDGAADAVLHFPEGAGEWPAVLAWPDIVGLRPVFREMGRRLAAMGYVVLTPNLYYRVRKAPVMGPDFSFARPEDREAVFALRASLEDQHVDRDSVAFIRFLEARPQTTGRKKFGVHGYCLGGGFAIRSAASAAGQVGAVASFHGAGLVTDSPASPHRLIASTSAVYLVEIASNDDAVDPDAKLKLAAELKRSELSGRIDVCPANHGWCVSGSAAYDEVQAEKAWARLIGLYGHAL